MSTLAALFPLHKVRGFPLTLNGGLQRILPFEPCRVAVYISVTTLAPGSVWAGCNSDMPAQGGIPLTANGELFDYEHWRAIVPFEWYVNGTFGPGTVLWIQEVLYYG